MTGDPNWGLPEWTNPADYPAPRGRGAMTIWAWEFLRRWPEYRTFWLEKIQPFIDKDGHISQDIGGQLWPYHGELSERFGVDLPSQPWSSTPANFVDNWTTYVKYDGRTTQTICLKQHQVAFFVDLSKPLNTQFKRALSSATDLQNYKWETGEISLKKPRAREQHYCTYLRVLDAYEAGAETKNIANVSETNTLPMRAGSA